MTQTEHQAKPVPEFITARLELYERLEDKSPKIEPHPIKVILLPVNSRPDAEGTEIEITAGETLPIDVMNEHFKGFEGVAAVVDGKMWDLMRPVPDMSKLGFVDFSDERGKEVFWHSSAHILGAAVELELGVELAIGPAQPNGFFYDFDMHDEKIDPQVLNRIQKTCESLCNKKPQYERKMITREEALELFASNPYKKDILTDRVEPGALVSVYKTGRFIDLCRGPHIPNARVIKSWWVIDISHSIFNGQADRKLNRIRAVTFPNAALMKEYKKFLEEAEKRNHRKLGVDHELFFFHPWSPGCAFWYPDGCHIYMKLMEMIRAQYKKRGFVEVMTPNLYYQDLFETSGHWKHYKDDMFHFPTDSGLEPGDPSPDGESVSCAEVCRTGRELGLKPMNCPGHCLLFKSRDRSYRDLPIRMAEFGVLHRNEATGALTGLTRGRKFVQDDAHIFARYDQIGEEMANALDFMTEVYGYFGLELEFTLSTINMEKYMGDLKVWESATDMLRQALINGHYVYTEAPNEAAFYGPKIDCMIKDCLGRKHQLATVQLDFQLPENFELTYFDAERKPKRPVMIHRAVLGSLERFIGITTEHFIARFPFWMSPHQIALIPQNQTKPEHMAKCQEMYQLLRDQGFTVTIIDAAVSMAKKIARARAELLCHAILVIGDQEIANGTVTVRWWNTPERTKLEPQPFESFLELIKEKVAKYQ